MAHIIPEGWQALQATGAEQREIETLAQLAAGLPDAYTVYHGVHWTRVHQGHALVGEIDFAIVNPAGNLLLIEQKSGYLSETPEGLTKHYEKKEKRVPAQMARSVEALRARLNAYCHADKPLLESLLYCPDYTVRQPGTAGIDPARIIAYLQRLVGSAQTIEAGSPLDGSDVEILTYASHADLMDKTKTAITRGLGAGFKKDMISVVTYRGREHSCFTPLDKLGPHALKAFTGQYDLLGSLIYSEGELFIDSVHRFKGQSAPCIVFTEIDFEELDEAALRKLFVGMTRATMKLVMVVSERAAEILLVCFEARLKTTSADRQQGQ
ncbi:MAG: ATP-binding domain-containing protein [Thiobacillus sp.]|nr:ATP-binding domain-containing protein [Thiobacillus sp.]